MTGTTSRVCAIATVLLHSRRTRAHAAAADGPDGGILAGITASRVPGGTRSAGSGLRPVGDLAVTKDGVTRSCLIVRRIVPAPVGCRPSVRGIGPRSGGSGRSSGAGATFRLYAAAGAVVKPKPQHVVVRWSFASQHVGFGAWEPWSPVPTPGGDSSTPCGRSSTARRGDVHAPSAGCPQNVRSIMHDLDAAPAPPRDRGRPRAPRGLAPFMRESRMTRGAHPSSRRLGDHGDVMLPSRIEPGGPVLVGVDAGATKAVAIAADARWRAHRARGGPGRQPQAPRPGRRRRPDRRRWPARPPAIGHRPSSSWPAPASTVRSTPAPSGPRSPTVSRPPGSSSSTTRLRFCVPPRPMPWASRCRSRPAATSSGVGPDGRVTDRGHGIFGGAYVLGALAARAARRGGVGEELRRHVDAVGPPVDRPPPRPRGRAPRRRRRSRRRGGGSASRPHGRSLVRPRHGSRAPRRSTAWGSGRSRRSSSTAACSMRPRGSATRMRQAILAAAPGARLRGPGR